LREAAAAERLIDVVEAALTPGPRLADVAAPPVELRVAEAEPRLPVRRRLALLHAEHGARLLEALARPLPVAAARVHPAEVVVDPGRRGDEVSVERLEPAGEALLLAAVEEALGALLHEREQAIVLLGLEEEVERL